MKIMERRYESKNGIVERTRYIVGDNASPRKRRRKGATPFRKQEQNFNCALRTVARILNCNFDHKDGLLLTLDYDAAGLESLLQNVSAEHRAILKRLQAPIGQIGTWGAKEKKVSTPEALGESVEEAMQMLRDAAEKQMMLWFRRIKRKHCGRIKALLITSDLDHDTGEPVRIHNHIVLQAESISWDLLQKEWKLGSVDIRQLRAQPDYTPIATYLMRQVRRQPEKKKYRVTRGMEKPKISNEIVVSSSEIKAPPGATVFERSEYSVEHVAQYIRYVPKKKVKTNEVSKIQGDPPKL